MSVNMKVADGVVYAVADGALLQLRDLIAYDHDGNPIDVLRPNKTVLTRREYVGLMTSVRSDSVKNIRQGGEVDETLFNLWEYVGETGVDLKDQVAKDGVAYCQAYEVSPGVTIFTAGEAAAILAGIPQEQPNLTDEELATLPRQVPDEPEEPPEPEPEPADEPPESKPP